MRTPPSLDPAAVRALRVSAQGIGGWSAPAPTVPGVVRRMLALQAQDAPGVRWSVGVRAPGTTDLAVTEALAAAEVVRTWSMRGTLHLVHPADVAWLLGLTAERMLRGMATRRSALGITVEDCTRSIDVAHKVLEGRVALARAAFLGQLEAHDVSTVGQRGYHLLAWLAISGHVVLGAGSDAHPAVMLSNEWLPPTRDLDREEALAELAVRYVGSHGPTSEADLARWAGLPITQARRGIAGADDRLEAVLVDGRIHHVAVSSLDTQGSADGPSTAGGSDSVGAVHLLPGFDEYLLGYADRSFAVAAEDAARVVPGGNGMFRPTVLLGGQVEGTWARVIRGSRTEIAVERFPGAPAFDAEHLADAAARLGAFIGKVPTVTIDGERPRDS